MKFIRLPKVVEEILYPAMEDGMLDIVMGKGPTAKTIRLSLEPFTLIGATTQIGKISSPMRDRFGLIQRLDFFSEGDLVEILKGLVDYGILRLMMMLLALLLLFPEVLLE